MKRIVRWVGSALAAILTLIALDRVCLEPFMTNERIRELKGLTKAALEGSNAIEQRVRARQNIELAESLRRRVGDDVAILMPLAANLRIVSRNREAADVYKTALLRARRPEIFRNLAEVQLEIGQRDDAIENYVLAAQFSPHVIPLITDPSIVAVVRSRTGIH